MRIEKSGFQQPGKQKKTLRRTAAIFILREAVREEDIELPSGGDFALCVGVLTSCHWELGAVV